MSLWLMVVDKDPRYASSLYNWLRSEDELRGLVTLTRGQPKPEEMGDLANVITIAIGSGGIASVVIGSLGTWLTQRQNQQVTVKVTTKNGTSVEVSGQGDTDSQALFKSIIDGVSEID